MAALLATGPVGLATVAAASGPSAGASASQSWIVMLRPGSNAAHAAPELARSAGGTVGFVYSTAISGFQFHGAAAAAAALRQNPNVVSVAVDGDLSLTESLPNGIERISAYDNDNTSASAWHAGFRGNGARIAVMDTGIDLDHPDLVNAIDQSLGYNCVTPGAPPNDGYGHGTHVAGTAAAPLNGVGVVGVAPQARLVAF
jgi:subtilisin family serine protease